MLSEYAKHEWTQVYHVEKKETTRNRNHCLPAVSSHLTLMMVALTSDSNAFAQNLTFERHPIDYHNAEVFDPVSKIGVKIVPGDIKLQHKDDCGYLR
ncbi:hypothetical protein N9B98_04655 [bacterium]|nr:hypothetical protein [bacterium]